MTEPRIGGRPAAPWTDALRLSWHRQSLRDLLAFLRRPRDVAAAGLDTGTRLAQTLSVLLIKIIAGLLVALAVGVFDIDPPNVSHGRLQSLHAPWLLLLIGAGLLPLVEEIAFRLALRFRPLAVGLAAGVFAYYAMTKIVFATRISDIQVGFGWRLTAFAVVAVAVTAWLRAPAWQRRAQQFWQQHFAALFYASALAFAAVHLFNFRPALHQLWVMPLMVLPQLIAGLCYGFIRIRHGFHYAYGAHAASNGLAIMLSLLFAGRG